MSHDEKLRVINEAFAIGNEVRFFVHDTEVLEAELRAGQQYSIYPRKFERVPDESAQTRDKTPPLRTEGPMINLQWILLSETGASVMMPVSVKVPEEISLAQLWHRHIANRVQRHVETVRWGKHFRGADEVEDGRVTDLQNNDSVHVIIPAEPAPKGQLEVVYTLEGESIVHRFNVRNTVTMGDIRQRISMAHKGKPIEPLSFERATFDDADRFNDWAFRSGGMPRQLVAKVQPMVQVVLDYMGVQKQMTVRKGTPKAEFLSQAKTFLGTSHNLDAIPLIPNPSVWEIIAGATYDIRETRQLTLKCSMKYVRSLRSTRSVTSGLGSNAESYVAATE
jgi:hypothetical protein